MPDHEPRDYRLARRAYEAYFDEQPQVWFDQLSHDYQMRWVKAARAVILELSKLPKGHNARYDPGDDAKIVNNAPRKENGRIDFKNMPADMAVKVRMAYQRHSKRGKR